MARLTYDNVIKEFELDFTKAELKFFVRKDGSNLEELYTALNKVDGFADVLNDSKPKKAPRLTYAGVIEELGLEELTEKDLRSLVRKNKTTLQEMYTVMKEDPYFQRELDIYNIQKDRTYGATDEVIDTLFGPNTPLPENTTIPTTITPEEFEKRKSHPSDGVRPQIMTKEQKKAYNTMLREISEQGTEAMQDLKDFIFTGDKSLVDKYGTDTSAIPEMPRTVVPLPTIKSVIRFIEGSYDKDAIADEIKAFTEHNIKYDLILTERFQKQLDSLLEAKYEDISQYEKLATKES